jgi:hypothetical protein
MRQLDHQMLTGGLPSIRCLKHWNSTFLDIETLKIYNATEDNFEESLFQKVSANNFNDNAHAWSSIFSFGLDGSP